MGKKLAIVTTSLCVLVLTATSTLAQDYLLRDDYNFNQLNKEEYERKLAENTNLTKKKLYQIIIKDTFLENFNIFLNGTLFKIGQNGKFGFYNHDGKVYFGFKIQ